MSMDKKNIMIYVNLFVHYPEVYNSNTISTKLNNCFKECFLGNELIDLSYKQECYVMIKSAPHSEVELINVEICNLKLESKLMNKVIIKLEKDINEYFNNQLMRINIEFN